jgi:predicted TIM-barrel fold metal-dependent hydrolase
MNCKIIDIHPHIISPDQNKYPPSPLFGVQSKWSAERPTSIEDMIRAMDDADVSKSAIVHASTCYGYNCSYLADSLARFPTRFTGVGCVDALAPDNVERAQHWIDRGFTGFRIFSGGSTTDGFDTQIFTDPRSFPFWELIDDKRLSVSLQTSFVGLPAAAFLAKKFPNAKVLLDHMGRPPTQEGVPYAASSALMELAQYPNIYLKLTTYSLEQMHGGKASPETFLQHVIKAFSAKRIAWGSNFPASPGHLRDHVATVRKHITVLSEDDQSWILGRTAQEIYPALKD